MITLFFLLTSLVYSSSVVAKHKTIHHRKHHVTTKKHAIKGNRKNKHHRTTKKQAVTKQAATSNRWNVNPKVWGLALKAFNNALQKGYIKQKVLTIIDYSLPSSVKRLWVVDVASKKVLYHTLVTHGKHTGGLFAKHFSDRPGSLASSLGLFVTENTYNGSNGYSLRLRGLEPGFNDRAHSRAIVMHGAWYATPSFAAHHGRLGVSWGCPVVSPQLVKPIINEIKDGSLIFAYYPDNYWLQRSKFLL